MKHRRVAIVVLLLAAYWAAFYFAAPRDSIGQVMTNRAGDAVSRLELLLPIVFRPEEWLLPNWFGDVIRFPLADRVPIWTLAAIIVAWATTVGWLALELFGVRRRLDNLEVWLFSSAVGLSLLSTWTLFLGLFGVLSRVWLCFIPAALTVAAAVLVRRGSKKAPSPADKLDEGLNGIPRGNLFRGGDAEGGENLSIRWFWIALPFLATIFLAAALPPLDFDVKEYHLQAPKEFFEQGQVTFLAHNVYANMAMGTEMLSLLSMVLVGDWWLGALVGKTVIAAYTPICALALFAAGRRWHSRRAGVLAALVYLSTPYLLSVSSAGLVEGASACYLFLAVYALLLATGDVDRFSWRLVALSGYVSGAAVATKYPAVLFVLIPLACFVVVSQVRLPSRAAKLVGVYLLAAALAGGLWFGKNLILTGNPTYPLLYSVFGGESWDAEKDARWNRVHRPHDFSAGTLATDMGRVTWTSVGLSPLLLPLAALAFLGVWAAEGTGRRSSNGPQAAWKSAGAAGSDAFRTLPPATAWILLGYAAFVVAGWWLFTHRIDRFWIPVLPVVALLAGVGACWTNAPWWRRTLAGMLVIGLTSNFLVAAASPGNAWFIPLDQLRERWINPWHWYFNNDREAGRVLAVGEAAVFDLATTPLYSTCFNDCRFEQLVKGKTADEVRAALAAKQIGYVFVNWSEVERYRSTYGFSDFVQPQVFEWLVKEGVLQPIEPLKDRFEQAFRVVKQPELLHRPTPPSRSGRSGT